MEASEKPQLPLDAGEPGDGSVRVLGDRLVVEEMTITDEATARVVRERAEAGEEPSRTIRRAIEIGTRVLDREDTAVEVDYVRREFEHLTNAHRETVERKNEEAIERIEEGLRRALGTDDAPGALGTALDAHSGELAELIAETFGEGRESAVQAQVKRLLEERDEEFMRRLAANDERNPLSPMLGTLREWAKERRADQDARDEKLERKLDELLATASEALGVQRGAEALAEAEEAGTRKGRSFEERVSDAIERLAATRGDCAHHVGDAPGAGGSKKGDVLVEIGAGEGASMGRVVFEVKDSRLSKPKAWEELNGAMDARGADYALLVVAGEEAIPSGAVEEMHEYQGNKLVVAVDPEEPDGRALELAYRYACLRVRAAREAASAVDATAVRTAAAEARDAIADFRGVKSALTSARKGVDRAQEGIEAIEASVLERLDRIEDAIDDPAADGDQPAG